VFPDDGSYKRFGHDFKTFKIIVCSKVRDGNKRTITIKDKLNFPIHNDIETLNLNDFELIIIDDLVQSAGTLIECKKALETYGYNKISAYVTHSIFPNDSWKKIISCGFYKFYTTNSVPEVTNLLEKMIVSPFNVLKLFGENEYKPKIIFVSSHNNQKLQAAWNNYIKIYKNTGVIVKGINVESNINPQPIGYEETKQGSFNRLNNMKKYLVSNNIEYDYLYSYENGIELIKSNESNESNKSNYCRDFCCFSFQEYNMDYIRFGLSLDNVLIPEKYFNKCVELKQQITIGEIIQEKTGIPKDSFHEFFNINKYNRVDIMSYIELN
jgi:hypoxanthine phosphoribosyltransferase